ncbi:ADP-ribosylation/Crystallin J1 [Mycena rosella]|uniref:ADP-ribosylhydrolase ARH3 n=1 Tax=Mycena rosella TaxID=1033263 RepID=A0AAD7CZN0_MYCRO|nr:ADP-ribosylation/Crystallin J1 [Mycena rosella]
MKPNRNFSLGAGVWTDDTSMMLALARSLGTYSGSARGVLRWYQNGVLSAIGRCFDIGSTIRRALGIYKDALKASGALSPAETRRLSPAAKEKEKEKRRTTAKSALARIARDLRGDGFNRNGSLMRVLPVGLAYARDPAGAAAYARRSSATTHPNAVCKAACAAWTECIARLVRSADAREEAKGAEQISKLDVLHHFAAYPWPADADALRVALAADVPLPAGAGALLTANMGDDADTVAAVYGGLAGVWYAVQEEGADGEEGLFWSPRVRAWRDALVRRDLIEEVAGELVEFVERHAASS